MELELFFCELTGWDQFFDLQGKETIRKRLLKKNMKDIKMQITSTSRCSKASSSSCSPPSLSASPSFSSLLLLLLLLILLLLLFESSCEILDHYLMSTRRGHNHSRNFRHKGKSIDDARWSKMGTDNGETGGPHFETHQLVVSIPKRLNRTFWSETNCWGWLRLPKMFITTWTLETCWKAMMCKKRKCTLTVKVE